MFLPASDLLRMTPHQPDRSKENPKTQRAKAGPVLLRLGSMAASWVGRHRVFALGALLLLLVAVIVGLSTLAEKEQHTISAIPDEGQERIEVQVLNATGEKNLALEVTEYLRGRGFDVVELGNADMPQSAATVVIDRCGRPEPARRVAAALGVPSPQVVSKPDRGLYLDVTVVLGRDFRKLQPKE